MKKTSYILFAIVAILFAAVPAGAETIDPLWQSRNNDIDGTAERIFTTGPAQCLSVKICNALIGGDVVYIGYDSSMDTTEQTALATTGFLLYPTAASGDTCYEADAVKMNTGMTYIDITNFWAVAGGIDSKVSGDCAKYGKRESTH